MNARFVAIVGLVLAVCGLVPVPSRAQAMPEGSLARGKELQQRLFRALDRAVSVTVVEHGNRVDIAGKTDYEPPVYARVNLNTDQIRSLRAALPAAKDKSGVVELDCIFDDHHAIVIRGKDGEVLTLNLCFVCGELSVNHDEIRLMPDGWPDSLSAFIASLGLHPHGPWPLPHK